MKPTTSPAPFSTLTAAGWQAKSQKIRPRWDLHPRITLLQSVALATWLRGLETGFILTHPCFKNKPYFLTLTLIAFALTALVLGMVRVKTPSLTEASIFFGSATIEQGAVKW